MALQPLAEGCNTMRGVAAAVTVILALGYTVPVAAQKPDAKPGAESTREAGKSTIGARSVTGTVKKTTDNGLVVMGRETGQKDKEWAFAVEAATRIQAGGQVRAIKELREGDPVTVTYTNRDGKIVAQSVTVGPR